MKYKAGLDVGSTTVKLVIIDSDNKIVFSSYERHFADVKNATLRVLKEAIEIIGKQKELIIRITGSAGMGLSKVIDVPFIQEVISCTEAVEKLIPETDVVIELGGEDSKITFLKGTLEQRMNGTCAGGTGAFIDQMASLLNTDAQGINEMAKKATIIYPIASRCGVFAKSDIQPLINQGASKEDIAASVMQAVVNQTIASLAAGRKIEGKIAFLGGPLYFLSELRKSFIETLKVKEEDAIFPENSLLFVALGAALYPKQNKIVTLENVIYSLEKASKNNLEVASFLEPLFESEDELKEFRARHSKASAPTKVLSEHSGAAYLGIDAGSTTSKIVLIDQDANILFSHYGNNKGEPLDTIKEVLIDLFKKLPKEVYIGKATVTGYGEELLKNALKIDIGIVETMAHYKAADHFQEGVDFILDIGGQDMKALTIKNGTLSSIQLNEACSSGCGSFIETFAKSMNYSIEDFAKAALTSKSPADLGSKCTVFMNSKVKQVQKEGFNVGDISAGLAYSVIKNSLYKVIKIKRPEELGKKIVCQGGTFYNEAVLRAFEKISGLEVVRPSIAGLMGAYGAALIAKANHQIGEKSSLISLIDLEQFTVEKEFTRCKICENKCMLTVTTFSDGGSFISGNRCERGAKIQIKEEDKRVNLVDYRYNRLFKYRPIEMTEATRGVIGIPRALNIYDNYPLWFTIFTDLGFRIELSPRSTKKIYETGIDTIPSDTVCYPAKISHGHVQTLINKGITKIFFPTVVYERLEHEKADNHYNCAVVQGYPNLLKHNIDEVINEKITYYTPAINLADKDSVIGKLLEEFKGYEITEEEMKKAVYHGFEELTAFKNDIKAKGEETLKLIEEKREHGIVLAGRPYHSDPEINHGISKVITQEGFHVLTEDSIYQLGDVEDLRLVNQWEYGSRIFAAAKVVAKSKNIDFVQLNSFGCSLDTVATDQISEILEQYGKVLTVLKIDEGSNLGTVKIRMRSLKVAIKDKEKAGFKPYKRFENPNFANFTKEMKEAHTILLPSIAPFRQNGLVNIALRASGYNAVMLPSKNLTALDKGLRFVNNEYCHPPIDYVGQIVEALESGKYDLNNTTIMILDPGTNCSCRGANFATVLRKAIYDAGYPDVPVVPMPIEFKDYETDERKSGFVLTVPLLKRLALANSYADLFEKVVYRTRPYEIKPGQIDTLHQKWIEKIKPNIENASLSDFRINMENIVKEFDNIPLLDIEKPKVGLVGDAELTINFAENGSYNIVRLLESEGVEVVVPGIGFMSTYLIGDLGDHMKELSDRFYNQCEKPMDEALRASKRFRKFYSIFDMKASANQIAPFANYQGKFWFMTGGKMIELLKDNVNNIVLYQAFNCAINYVCGVGLNKEIKRQYPQANIVNIDYDPGMSMVNQVNRIKLMISNAEKDLEREDVI